MELIRPMVRGCYDLQMLRMQAGLRLAANFRAKLGKKEGELDERIDPEAEDGKLSEEAESILDQLRASYKTLTSGIARNRTLPSREGFVGTELIHSYSELVLVHQFIALEREETRQFNQLGESLFDEPIYTDYLQHQPGIGPAMAGVLISKLDPYKADHISSFWKYAGLDVVLVECEYCEATGTINAMACPYCQGSGFMGEGRSRRDEHLVTREYINKKGQPAHRLSITYDPWLKTKLFVLAGCFMRATRPAPSPWKQVYYDYKNRLLNDSNRRKITVEKWKELKADGEDIRLLYTPGRIDAMSKRYMLKMFLADLWVKWRTLEGLPLTPTYHEAILGHRHHGGRQAAE